MNDIVIAAFETIRADLLREGYVEGPPPGQCQEATAIDREICAEQACLACGHLGLEYRPFHLSDHARLLAYRAGHYPPEHRYRPLAVCPACGTAEAW